MSKRLANRRRTSKRAMWLALGIFFAGQFIVGYLLDYKYPVMKFPAAGATADRAAPEAKRPEIIFFGSSRTMTGIVTTEADKVLAQEFGKGSIPPTFNAGVVAGDSYSAEFVFHLMLERGVKPKLAIFEISPEMLGARPPFVGEHVVRQFNWSHITELPAMLKANSALSYAEGRFAPLYTHRKQIVKLGKEEVRDWFVKEPAAATKPTANTAPGAPVVTDNLGMVVPSLPPRPETPEAERKLMEQSQAGASRVVRRWLRNYRIGGPAPPALERMLARCKAEGIPVILLGIPACTAHRNEFTVEMLSGYYGYVNDLVRTYGCQFVDAMSWLPDLQFGDTLHIRSETGGIAFTSRLTKEAIVPAVRKQR